MGHRAEVRQLVNFAAPGTGAGHTVTAESSVPLPEHRSERRRLVAAGPARRLDEFRCADAGRDGPHRAGRRRLDVADQKAADFARRLVVPVAGSVTAVEDSASITMTAGTTTVTIGKSNGRATGVLRAGLPVS